MARVIRVNQARSNVVNNDEFCVLWHGVCALIKAGAIYKASGDGSLTTRTGVESSGVLASNKFNLALTNVQVGMTGATLAAMTNGGLVTITGLSGLVVPTDANQGGSEGNFLTFTGFADSANNNGTFQIVEVVSSTACRIYNANANLSDANNGTGSIGWTEQTIIGTYSPTFATGKNPWVCLEVGRTIKVPITSAAATSLVRGEKVTQGSGPTLCEGEFLGAVYSSASGSGWAVIAPRDRNTWQSASAITGATSGLSFTPSALPKIFVNEMVFWKSVSNMYQGSWYWSCLDTVAENAYRFSVLATTDTCVGNVAPGGHGTASIQTNSMPTVPGIMVCTGAAAVAVGATWAVTSQSHGNLFSSNNGPTAQTNFHIMCGNFHGTPTSPAVAGAAATSGRTPEASFTFATHDGTPNIYGISFQRFDDCEPGDVCPWAVLTPDAQSRSTFNRFNSSINYTWSSNLHMLNGTNLTCAWKTFMGRSGPTARDLAAPMQIETNSPGSQLMAANYAQVPREINHPDAIPPYKVKSPKYTFDGGSITNGSAPVTIPKGEKGRPRFVRMIGAGSAPTTTADSKKWVQVFTGFNGASASFVIGPFDGSTTPATG